MSDVPGQDQAGIGTAIAALIIMAGSVVTSVTSAFKVSSLSKSVVYKDTCEKCGKNNDNQQKANHEAIQLLIATMIRYEEKLDRVLLKGNFGK